MIGLIGGSGFYETNFESIVKKVKTPFGKINVSICDFNGTEIAFITRHGTGHKIPPHLVNYKANIFALYKLGVNRILSTSAVGSLLPQTKPGTFVIPNQFIDFTIGRPKTYFDGNFKIKLHSGKLLQGVVHTDVTSPYCSSLREQVVQNAIELKLSVVETGVYVCTEGPRFETPAEIKAFTTLGGTIVGMTSVSECILARELEICYTTICLVTNYAAGLQEKITVEEVFIEFKQNILKLRTLIEQTIRSSSTDWRCKC